MLQRWIGSFGWNLDRIRYENWSTKINIFNLRNNNVILDWSHYRYPPLLILINSFGFVFLLICLYAMHRWKFNYWSIVVVKLLNSLIFSFLEQVITKWNLVKLYMDKIGYITLSYLLAQLYWHVSNRKNIWIPCACMHSRVPVFRTGKNKFISDSHTIYRVKYNHHQNQQVGESNKSFENLDPKQ